MSESTDIPNLAELFPADGNHWREFESISPFTAVLLSLGIEPRTIELLRQQEQLELVCSYTPELLPEASLHLGQQHLEFERRHDVLTNAIDSSVLPIVRTQKGNALKKIRVVDFVTWASAKNWVMPAWLCAIHRISPEPRPNIGKGRENQCAKTQEQYRLWQLKANELKRTNPSLSDFAIAQKISRSDVGNDKSVHTIRKHILL